MGLANSTGTLGSGGLGRGNPFVQPIRGLLVPNFADFHDVNDTHSENFSW